MRKASLGWARGPHWQRRYTTTAQVFSSTSIRHQPAIAAKAPMKMTRPAVILISSLCLCAHLEKKNCKLENKIKPDVQPGEKENVHPLPKWEGEPCTYNEVPASFSFNTSEMQLKTFPSGQTVVMVTSPRHWFFNCTIKLHRGTRSQIYRRKLHV